MDNKGPIVWIIDDDKITRSHHRLSFEENRPDIRVLEFECLYDASQRDLGVDFIFIDLSAIDGRTLPCFDNHSYIRNLQLFVKRHSSAFIVIVSALISDAEEDVEDLQAACPDIRLFALDICGIENHDPLVDFVNRYSNE